MPRKLVEVTTENGTTYHDTFENAAAIAKLNLHRWEGTRKLVLVAKNPKAIASDAVTWVPKQSGKNGPLVLQLVR